MFMQSNGGLADARFFQGKDSILSGPAGGIVGAVRTATMAGFDEIIGFDMGGTSTDVSHYAGEYERAFETLVAGVRMRAPMMQIHTVAAGGGSILFFDGARFRCGPESAGANPGPACYRRGGPLCVTDANMHARQDPAGFLPGGVRPQRRRAARRATWCAKKFAALAEDVRKATGEARSPEEIADGFLKIAVENMANAIKQISVQRGYDVTEYALCTLRRRRRPACLPRRRRARHEDGLHPSAGRRAVGLRHGPRRPARDAREGGRGVARGQADRPARARRSTSLAKDGMDEMRRQGLPEAQIEVQRKVHLKYEGTDSTLVIDWGTCAAMVDAFAAAHRQRYGFMMPDKRVIVEAVAVEAVGHTESADDPVLQGRRRGRRTAPRARVTMHAEGAGHDTPVYDRDHLKPGMKRRRPGDHRREERDHHRRARLARRDHRARPHRAAPRRPAAARHGGRHAGRPGHARGVQQPVHVDRRADGRGAAEHRLLGQHQGAARLLLRAVRPRRRARSPTRRTCRCISARWARACATIMRLRAGTMRPGDVFVLNAPYNGGTHLPDVTVITPVFDDAGQGDPVLRRLARPPGGYRRHDARLDAARIRRRSRRRAC